MKKVRLLLYILYLVVVMEIGVRVFFLISIGSAFHIYKASLLSFYPELKEVPKNYSDREFNILVLAGSVLYQDTIEFPVDTGVVLSSFCDISQHFPDDHPVTGQKIHVYNLARPAHTTMDSWYKYQYLQDTSFDVVIVYHGINDSRTNNISTSSFKEHYRHIAFYNSLFILHRHEEVDYFTLPYAIDLLTNNALVKLNIWETIPRDFSQMYASGKIEKYYRYGNKIKSAAVLRNNLENILTLAASKQETVVLSTYCYYLTDDYSLQAFLKRELDYDEQLYPAEIYGYPANVVKGIQTHNNITRSLAGKDGNSVLVDSESQMPKSGAYFNDICHLNENGCQALSGYFWKAIEAMPPQVEPSYTQ